MANETTPSVTTLSETRYLTPIDIVGIQDAFTYHPPKGDQALRYVELREAAKDLALRIMERCPPSRERSLAITNLQQSIMWANASIAVTE